MTDIKGDRSQELNERERTVLASVIELYLDSGEPVASRHVAQQQGERWSSATLRNVLARLEEGGWLAQPHPSAGRVPTLEALRVYVGQLPAPTNWSAADEEQLRQTLGAAEGPELLARACQFLSAFSRRIGVVAVAPLADPGLKHIRFLRLGERRLLAILVAADDQFRERVVRVPGDYRQEELDQAARFLNANFAGWKLERIRRELLRRVSEDRAAYDQLLQRVLVLYHSGVLEMQDSGQVFVEGAGNLVPLLESHERLAAILQALEEKEKVLALVSGIAEENGEAPGGAPAVHIQVGLANLPDFALVAAPYRMPDQHRGAVAILSPARLEYERAAGAVWRVREIFCQVIRDN